MALASGEAISHRLAVPALSADQVGLAERGWARETPLWFYILKEADVLHDGDRVVRPAAASSVRYWWASSTPIRSPSGRSDPDWTPRLPGRRAGAFGLDDMLVPVH